MATVNKVIETAANLQVVQWASLTATNTDGSPYEVLDYNDHSVQMSGDFGVGGTLLWQGSNDGTNWFSLTDAQGSIFSKTEASLEQVVEAPRYVRPLVSAGTGVDVDVILVARRARTI